MKILVLNAGSGSQKAALFDLSAHQPLPEVVEPAWLARLSTTDPEQPSGAIQLVVERDGEETIADAVDEDASVEMRTKHLLDLLWDDEDAPLAGPDDLDAVGHRVVHGGNRYSAAVAIDAAVEESIQHFSSLAPLHNPNNLTGIQVAQEMVPEARHFAVFDTAFHHTLPESAYTYPGPYRWIERGIRRFGFHGTSFRWASRRVSSLLNRDDDPDLRLVLCHLGGGCSLCATRGGRSIDTTMGFTPLDGIAMSTRSGSLDPGLLLHLLREGETVDDLDQTLNHESGLSGLSEGVGDSRVVRANAKAGDRKAQLALDVFLHRLRAGVGEMVAALGEVPHAIAFTDVIGETDPGIRAAACEALFPLGASIDEERNARSILDASFAGPGSTVDAFVIGCREEWQIARDCSVFLTRQFGNQGDTSRCRK